MSLNTYILSDLPDIYEALSDIKASYNGIDIYMFYENDYVISDVNEKIVKAQIKDMTTIAVGENILIESISYCIVNFEITKDKLEILISITEV